MYNLIEYSDNYPDTSGSLCQFKRDEVPANNVDLDVDSNGIFSFQSFKYKAAFVGKISGYVNSNRFVKNAKIVVPLINCKVHLELNWIEDCILSSARNFAKFKITDAKLHVPIVNLSTKDNVNLSKQLSDGFKRSVY